jgi:hypothetical protein
MENNKTNKLIISKINQGQKFGLYDRGRSCYFDDGTRFGYNELWSALREMYQIEDGHKKTLFELCPLNYRGVITYKFTRFRILRFLGNLFYKIVNPKLFIDNITNRQEALHNVSTLVQERR